MANISQIRGLIECLQMVDDYYSESKFLRLSNQNKKNQELNKENEEEMEDLLKTVIKSNNTIKDLG